jgi:RNA polymerase sigma-70 factor (ECF subfamily)
MLSNDYVHIDHLVERVKHDDDPALHELYDFYKPFFAACASRVCKKYHNLEKDDLILESIFILKELCKKYDKDKSFFSYFLETRMQSYMISKVKSKYCENVTIIPLNEYDSYEPCENCSVFEDHTELKDEIDNLPQKMKQIIEMVYFKQLTQSECAVILNISQAAVSKRLKQAIKKLKEKLENRL